jgi:hypothetical protein
MWLSMVESFLSKQECPLREPPSARRSKILARACRGAGRLQTVRIDAARALREELGAALARTGQLEAAFGDQARGAALFLEARRREALQVAASRFPAISRGLWLESAVDA